MAVIKYNNLRKTDEKGRFLPGNSEDLTGSNFGSWEVLSFSRTKNRRSWQICKCLKCGTIKEVRTDHLKSGKSKSCGSKECKDYSNYARKHGLWKTVEYRVLKGIVQRCRNKNFKQYKDYGGRGIDVYQPWVENVVLFVEEVGLRPSKRHWIERIDNEKGYFPGNVKWATIEEQKRNLRVNRFYEYKGEKLLVGEIAKKENISRDRLEYFLARKGFSVSDAIKRIKTVPSRFIIAAQLRDES